MKRILLTLAFVCFVMPVLLSADTPEPPPAPPVPVNIAAIKARRAQIAELLKQDAADIAELQKQLKELGLSTELAPLGLGKQGPRGYSAYEVAKQNGFKGTQAEWLASLKGERGPQGPPGPPGPGPNPPPEPPPVPPQPTKDFRVLFLYETSDKLTREQLNTINSAQIREYLNRKVVKGPKGPDYRFWDQNVDVMKESQTLQDMYAAAKPLATSLPAVVIFSGTAGKYYPLPETEADTLKLLKQYGGE